MKKQAGSALVVVLSFLTVSLMVGLSSMQSSQVDERLAGNYKAQSVAQMAAEDGASQSVDILNQAVEDGLLALVDLPLCDARGLVAEQEVSAGAGSVDFTLFACRNDAGGFDLFSEGRVYAGDDIIARRTVKTRALDPGTGFLGLSPITVPSGIKDDASKDDPCFEGANGNTGSFCFELSYSQAELTGEQVVDGVYNPAINVASEDDKLGVMSTISQREDNYKGGVEAGMSESILLEENIDDFDAFIGEVDSVAGDVRTFSPGEKDIDFGVKGSEVLTVIDGDFRAGNNFSGAGALVVKGNAEFNGTPSYSGLIIVLGTYAVGGGGSSQGQGGFEGAIISAPYATDDDGKLYYEDTGVAFSGGGGADYVYSVGALKKAFGVMEEAGEFWEKKNLSSRRSTEILPDYSGWEDL